MTYEKDYSKENVKLIFNVSKGLINYSQRNNEYVWKRKKLIVRNTNTCNTTSLCMGSSYAGWIFPKEPYPEFEQEEDRLTKFCLEDPRVSEFYKKKMYTLWKQWQDGDEDAFPPNQIHEILEFAVNTWFGSTVVKFNVDTPINDIFNEIVFKNRPVVVSGNFPKSSTSEETIGHIVVIVGLIFDEYKIKDYNGNITIGNELPSDIIFDDPWGNFMEGYEKNLSGNDVVCPYNLAIKYLKPQKDITHKWAYLFNKGAAII